MPKYTVKDPISGRTVVLNGDSPPTEAELNQIFAQINGQPSTPQGSVTSRVLGGVGDMLNPVTIASSLLTSLLHPIDTAGALIHNQIDQGRQAISDAEQGRISEAIGHGGAAVLPIVGPMAANIGQNIAATGDIARGVGQGIGLIAPALLAPAAAGAAKVVGRALPNAAADALEEGAVSRVADVMTPKRGANKLRFGNAAVKTAPGLLENGDVAGFTRTGLQSRVEAGLEAAKQQLDAATDTRLASQQVKTGPIVDALNTQIAQLTASPADAERLTPTLQGPGGTPQPSGLTRNIQSGQMQKALTPEGRPYGQPVQPAPNQAAIDTLTKMRDEVVALGPVAPYKAVQIIRNAWDQVALQKYLPSTAQDAMKSQGVPTAAMQGTGAMRQALAEVDPATAAANANYSLYKNANDVLKAAAETERTTPSVGRQIMARLIGSTVGEQAAGLPGAAAGYALGPIVDSALRMGATTKLQTARLMQAAADAIRSGDVSGFNTILLRLQRLTKYGVRAEGATGATNPSGSQTPLGATSGGQP